MKLKNWNPGFSFVFNDRCFSFVRFFASLLRLTSIVCFPSVSVELNIYKTRLQLGFRQKLFCYLRSLQSSMNADDIKWSYYKDQKYFSFSPSFQCFDKFVKKENNILLAWNQFFKRFWVLWIHQWLSVFMFANCFQYFSEKGSCLFVYLHFY